MSELELFLHQSATEGDHDSQGEFTLAREKRLAKLAEFQLPYKTAWAVKLIQAAVCCGQAEDIKVSLFRKESRFSFSANWDLEELEAGFFEPELVEEPSLRHLLQALWPVALAQKRPFLVSLQGSKEGLYWDGEVLVRRDLGLKKRTAVTVGLLPRETQDSSFERSNRNAALALSLQSRCFSCPIPLKVDGRRLDSLLYCPEFGWGGKACPLGIAFPEAGLSALSFPPGTFDAVASSKILDQDPVDGVHENGFLRIGRSNLRKVESSGLGDFAFLLSFGPRKQRSTVFWVLDGVVVDSEPIAPATQCAVGCYVSAQDMETDLTSLQILASPERSRIVERVSKATLVYLKTRPQSLFPLGTLESKAGLLDTVVGMGTMFTASLLFFAPLPVGVFLFIGALGASITRIAFSPSKEHFRVLGRGFVELLEALEA